MNILVLNIFQRRALLLCSSFLVAAAACGIVVSSLLAHAMDALDVMALAIFVVIMFWGSFNFWLFVFGFWLEGRDLNRRERVRSEKTCVSEGESPSSLEARLLEFGTKVMNGK